jgi:hypothetical protein
LLARFEAQPVALAASLIDSTDSYNGDDAWCYLYEWDKALGGHWEVTQETERLEAAMAASQTTLAAVEGESSAARVWLADSDAKVVGRILRRNTVPLSLCSVMFFLMILSLPISALTEKLEALQLAANNAARVPNTQGDLVVSRL